VAKDTLEVLDHLGWTEDKSVHLVGHSMGGMIAPEMALLSTSRIASLTLLATTSHWRADLSLAAAGKSLVTFFAPKSQDQRLAEVKAQFFGESWPSEPDEGGVFPTNGDAWAATSYLNSDVQYRGAIFLAPACVRHRVAPADLQRLVEKIGGSNIQIMHGRSDKIAPFSAAERLYSSFGGDGSGVRFHAFEDTGHLLPLERFGEIAVSLEEVIRSGERRAR